jgi:hypothetical protein
MLPPADAMLPDIHRPASLKVGRKAIYMTGVLTRMTRSWLLNQVLNEVEIVKTGHPAKQVR